MDKQNTKYSSTSFADACVKMDGFGVLLILLVMASALFNGPISFLNLYIHTHFQKSLKGTNPTVICKTNLLQK